MCNRSSWIFSRICEGRRPGGADAEAAAAAQARLATDLAGGYADESAATFRTQVRDMLECEPPETAAMIARGLKTISLRTELPWEEGDAAGALDGREQLESLEGLHKAADAVRAVLEARFERFLSVDPAADRMRGTTESGARLAPTAWWKRGKPALVQMRQAAAMSRMYLACLNAVIVPEPASEADAARYPCASARFLLLMLLWDSLTHAVERGWVVCRVFEGAYASRLGTQLATGGGLSSCGDRLVRATGLVVSLMAELSVRPEFVMLAAEVRRRRYDGDRRPVTGSPPGGRVLLDFPPDRWSSPWTVQRRYMNAAIEQVQESLSDLERLHEEACKRMDGALDPPPQERGGLGYSVRMAVGPSDLLIVTAVLCAALYLIVRVISSAELQTAAAGLVAAFFLTVCVPSALIAHRASVAADLWWPSWLNRFPPFALILFVPFALLPMCDTGSAKLRAAWYLALHQHFFGDLYGGVSLDDAVSYDMNQWRNLRERQSPV